MTLLYLDPVFTEHRTGRHPENAGRVQAIREEFEQYQLHTKCIRPQWQPATSQQQQSVHSAEYTEYLREVSATGGGNIEQDTVVSSQSWLVTQSAAGAACDAVDRVLDGQDHNAFCVIRPPGHHALRSAAMGFCLLNNVAIAARHAVRSHGLNRVLIIDWDVHHGNGTQAIFYDDPQVAFYSMHRWPFYPGTGDNDETGSGPGLGTTKNDPITFGTKREEILKRFSNSIESFADSARPELILLSAGFDAHHLDPVGSLGLETEDFEALTTIAMQLAATHCNNRIVSLLEGGYHPKSLAQSAAVHLQTLLS